MESVHQRLSKHILTDGYPFVMDLEKSHQSYVVDEKGEEYLDMFSMFGSSPIGYNHPYILAHKELLGTVAINKPTLSDIYDKNYADFVDTFSRLAMPAELQYAFFIAGGSMAVENALKAAFDWKTRLNLSRGIHKEASKVIHFKQAFHGRSGYTLSLTNTADPRKYMYFPKFDWPRILNPKLHFPLTEESLSHTIQEEKLAISQIEEALQQYPHETACIIIETIQAEGGDNHFRKEFLQKLRSICDEHEILFIMDEVQTGMGLTGKMWAYQHYDVVPDIISFGKKAQVCGILTNKKKLDIVPHNVFRESSRINSTFGGDLVDMVRCKLILEVMEKENLLQHATEQGDYLLQKIQALDSPDISNQRGLGLLAAFDLSSPEKRNALVHKALEHKLILLSCGEKTIRFRPHLTVTKEEIDKAISIIQELI